MIVKKIGSEGMQWNILHIAVFKPGLQTKSIKKHQIYTEHRMIKYFFLIKYFKRTYTEKEENVYRWIPIDFWEILW